MQIVHFDFYSKGFKTFTLKSICNLSRLSLEFIYCLSLLGSGRQVVASSDGVYLDVTPPVIEELFNIDVNWKETQPIMFQSSNSTIAVQWIADDKETQVSD